MRKILILAACLITYNGYSQSFRISGNAYKTTAEQVSAAYGNGGSYSGEIESGLQWGVAAEYLFNQKYGMEIEYQSNRSMTPITFKSSNMGSALEYFDLHIGWLVLKGNRYFGQKSNKIQGFVGLGAGVSMINAETWYGQSAKSYLALQANTGMIYWPIQVIGIKLNGQYQYNPQGTGSVFLVGRDYSPLQKTLTTSSSLSQFGLGIGLVFVLDNIANTK